MSGFVYIWRDRKHNRYYIGSHWGPEDDGYICSSTWMIQAYKKRPKDFKRRIISRIISSRSDLLDEELRWLNMIRDSELKKKYYNIFKKTKHWHSDETRLPTIRQRIAQKTKEAMQREDIRENYLEGLSKRDNRSSDPEVRTKRSKSMRKTMEEKFPTEDRRQRMEFGSEEYREFMSNSTSELWNRPGHRESVGAKISASLKGKKKTVSLLWWNNGSINTRSPVSPGEDWERGKLRAQ
jgi:hypothetical protein